MTRIWLVNWHFQSRIILWCRHKSTNVSMGLCWQMPKFIVWCLWSIYFDHHLPLKPSIGKRRKQSCTPNISNYKKIMRFAGFFCVQIYSWNANISWTLQFILSGREAAWYWNVPPDRSPFIYYATCWSGRGNEENCGWGMGREVEEIGQFSLTGRIVFHILFML